MNFICRALVFSLLYKLSVEGATIGVWFSSPSCSGSPSQTYIAYSDVCTAREGVAITLTECSASDVKMIEYPDSSSEKIAAPKCGTGKGFTTSASTSCKKFSDFYTKVLENTCTATNVFIANPRDPACTTARDQRYSTIIADGTCRSWYESSIQAYTASVVSNTKIDLKAFYSPTCNASDLESVWDEIPTTGTCKDAVLKSSSPEFRSVSVSVPVPFLLSSTIAAILLGIIIGPIIGSIVCCCVCWGALHACGVVNCPCFNRCCDRRKNIASSNSNSFPSTAYATQAPRSSPYGNARL